MPATILRSHWWKNLTMAVNTALTEVLDVGGMASGSVFVPLGWNAADLCFLVAPDSNAYKLAEDTTGATPAFTLLRDAAGVAVRISGVVPGTWHLIPTGALVMKYIQIQSTNVGAITPTNQADARALMVALKS